MYAHRSKTNQYLENGLNKSNKLKLDQYLRLSLKYFGLEVM